VAVPHSLFNDVLLADSAAMGASGASVKTGSMRRTLYLVAAVLCLILAMHFTVSFFNNRGLATTARDAAVGISSAESAGQDLASLDSLRKLETLRQSLETLVKYRAKASLGFTAGACTPATPSTLSPPHLFRPLPPTALPANADRHPGESAQPPGDPRARIRAHLRRLEGLLITTSHHDKSTKLFLTPVLTKWWAGNRGPDADRLALAQKQFDFYATELAVENPSPRQRRPLHRTRPHLSQAIRRRRARLPSCWPRPARTIRPSITTVSSPAPRKP